MTNSNPPHVDLQDPRWAEAVRRGVAQAQAMQRELMDMIKMSCGGPEFALLADRTLGEFRAAAVNPDLRASLAGQIVTKIAGVDPYLKLQAKIEQETRLKESVVPQGAGFPAARPSYLSPTYDDPNTRTQRVFQTVVPPSALQAQGLPARSSAIFQPIDAILASGAAQPVATSTAARGVPQRAPAAAAVPGMAPGAHGPSPAVYGAAPPPIATTGHQWIATQRAVAPKGKRSPSTRTPPKQGGVTQDQAVNASAGLRAGAAAVTPRVAPRATAPAPSRPISGRPTSGRPPTSRSNAPPPSKRSEVLPLKTSGLDDLWEMASKPTLVKARRMAASLQNKVAPRSGGYFSWRDPAFDLTKGLQLIDEKGREALRFKFLTPDQRRAAGVFFESDLPEFAKSFVPQPRSLREATLVGLTEGARRANTEMPGLLDRLRYGVARHTAARRAYDAQRKIIHGDYLGLFGTAEDALPTFKDKVTDMTVGAMTRYHALPPAAKGGLALGTLALGGLGLRSALQRRNAHEQGLSLARAVGAGQAGQQGSVPQEAEGARA